jgi:hypothetical protein
MAQRKKASTGRNDPCPCGSGKKYKKCCLHAPSDSAATGNSAAGGNVYTELPNSDADYVESGSAKQSGVLNPALSNRVNDDLRDALAGQQFESIEQANAFVQQHMAQRNSTGLAEFHGLSPEQMNLLINHPFDSPALVTFPDNYRVDDTVPYVFFFDRLLAAVGNNNFKPTERGNLPRNFCRVVALKWEGEDGYAKRTRYGGINSESDFFELNCFRHVCEFAGYLRKYRGKYIIGKECRQLLKVGGPSAVYRGLFKTYSTKLDWGFGDGYPEFLSLIQRFWAFALYLLQQFGDQWRPAGFYENAFLRAFPALADPTLETSYQSAEEAVKAAFRIRVLQHWLPMFGLAEFENLEPDELLSRNYRVRKTPLADQVAVFTV